MQSDSTDSLVPSGLKFADIRSSLSQLKEIRDFYQIIYFVVKIFNKNMSEGAKINFPIYCINP